jgi:sporulation protein YlmC with PRC-barrel domain
MGCCLNAQSDPVQVQRIFCDSLESKMHKATFFIHNTTCNIQRGVSMTRGVLHKDVSTLSGVNVGKVKDVLINWDNKEISLDVTKGLLKGETIVPWSKIISVGDIIIVSDDLAPEESK